MFLEIIKIFAVSLILTIQLLYAPTKSVLLISWSKHTVFKVSLQDILTIQAPGIRARSTLLENLTPPPKKSLRILYKKSKRRLSLIHIQHPHHYDG